MSKQEAWGDDTVVIGEKTGVSEPPSMGERGPERLVERMLSRRTLAELGAAALVAIVLLSIGGPERPSVAEKPGVSAQPPQAMATERPRHIVPAAASPRRSVAVRIGRARRAAGDRPQRQEIRPEASPARVEGEPDEPAAVEPAPEPVYEPPPVEAEAPAGSAPTPVAAEFGM